MTCSMCNVSTRPDVPRQELFVKFKFCSLFMLRQHDDSSDKHQNEKCKLLRSERDAAQTRFQERRLFAMESTRYRQAQSLGRSAKKPWCDPRTFHRAALQAAPSLTYICNNLCPCARMDAIILRLCARLTKPRGVTLRLRLYSTMLPSTCMEKALQLSLSQGYKRAPDVAAFVPVPLRRDSLLRLKWRCWRCWTSTVRRH